MNHLAVVQSAPVWLPRTQTWMHAQNRNLPAWIESHVVCDRTENLDLFPTPNLHVLHGLPRLADKLLRASGLRRHLSHLPRVARATGARVLHSHFGHVGWLDLGGARRAGLRQIVTFYGQDVRALPQQDPRWYTRYRQMFAQVALVLCEGPHMGRCIEELGCPRARIRVHHLGIDTTAFAFRPRVWRRGETLRVLLCATFTPKKGLTFALEALGRLRRSTPLAITLIGDAGSSPAQQDEKQRILATIAACGLQDVVTRTGYLPPEQILQHAHANHVFVQPSVTAADGDTEGGAPVTLIELAATGMPVVATRHCDIPEVVTDGAGALLADERDVDGLCACLQRLVTGPELWSSLPQAARARIEQHFDQRRQGEALARIYAEVAGFPAPVAAPDREPCAVG